MKKWFSFGGMSLEEFWKWFEDNSTRLRSMEMTPAAHEIAGKLTKVSRDLVLGIGAADEKGNQSLEICAGGLKANIPEVERIVAAAPRVMGWKIVAFRQPAKEPMSFSVGSEQLSSEQVLYQVLGKSDGYTHVRLFLPLPAASPKSSFQELGFICLDHTLGELLVMTKLGKLEFESTVSAPPGSKPLSELAAELR